MDLAAPIDEPVRATAGGQVIVAGVRGGYGLLVELRHRNGYSTRYAHLSRIASELEPARLVRKGEIIGYVGMSGLATAPHLHYEVRRDGAPRDPLQPGYGAHFGSENRVDPVWHLERRRLAALLARTPAVEGIH